MRITKMVERAILACDVCGEEMDEYEIPMRARPREICEVCLCIEECGKSGHSPDLDSIEPRVGEPLIIDTECWHCGKVIKISILVTENP